MIFLVLLYTLLRLFLSKFTALELAEACRLSKSEQPQLTMTSIRRIECHIDALAFSMKLKSFEL